MPTKAELIVNLEEWSFIQYPSEEVAHASVERYLRYLQKKVFETGLEVIG